MMCLPAGLGLVAPVTASGVPEAVSIWNKLSTTGRWYEFAEPSGTTVIDSHNGLNGTYENSPTLGVTGGPANSPSGARFNGTNQSALIPRLGFIVGSGSWSLLFFLKSNSTTQTNTYLMCTGEDPQAAILYEYLNNNVELFGGASDAGARPGSQLPLANTNVHQIGYCYSSAGPVRRGILDGVADFSNANSINFSASSHDTRLAASNASGGAADFCNVTLYQLVAVPANLTAAEVSYLYNGGSGRGYVGFKSDAGH